MRIEINMTFTDGEPDWDDILSPGLVGYGEEGEPPETRWDVFQSELMYLINSYTGKHLQDGYVMSLNCIKRIES